MCNILVVDDDAAIRSALVAALEDEGYVAESSSDGHWAIEHLDDARVDLMLVDMRMPPLDGPDMVRILRRKGNDTPVIMMSAQPAKLLPDGVRFIRKPFDLDRLFEVIEEMLAS
jgi:DNA-binding NtrC family response regulator